MKINKQIKILLAGSYLWYFGAGLLGPLYVVFSQKVGGDILDVTGPYAAYLIIAGLVSIVVGKWSDRHHSYKKLMIFGYCLNTLATFGYLFVDSTLKLLILQIVFGVASAFAILTWDTLFSENVDKKREGEEWGFSDGGPYVVMGVALLFGGFILEHFGFRFLFLVMGLFQLLATVVQSLILVKSK